MNPANLKTFAIYRHSLTNFAYREPITIEWTPSNRLILRKFDLATHQETEKIARLRPKDIQKLVALCFAIALLLHFYTGFYAASKIPRQKKTPTL